MQDDLTKAQHYRVIEQQMRESAAQEHDQKRRKELTGLADQYRRLADKLVGRHADPDKS
ncbi:MAG TPA: hypothetical protein VFW28_18040 [Micropepsaceae bacterium]|nr:hypothetical protein [Micropepsaceae bacterium]